LISAEGAFLNTRQLLGLSLGGVAHLVPDRVGRALTAFVGLVHRAVFEEPIPASVPVERVGDVHHALKDRAAPAKTVHAVNDRRGPDGGGADS
jgi:NADPH:quinone reductase